MNDLITAATSGLFVEIGRVIQHMKAQASRIAELERQLAAPSAPAVGRQQWSHITPRDFVEVATAIMDQHGLMDGLSYEKTEKLCEAMEESFKKLPHPAPLAADTDKVREAVEAMNRAKLLPIWDNDVPHKLHVELDVIFKALSSMAAQAPVREVPGWISVKDRLPAQGMPVFVYTPANKHSDERIDFDCIDPEDDTASTWDQHNQHYEHWCCVAKPEGSIGPSAEAPYTHWMPLPAAPVQQEGGRG